MTSPRAPVITIPWEVLFHPATRDFPSIPTAHGEHGGIPQPIPPPLVVDCSQLAGAISADFSSSSGHLEEDDWPTAKGFFQAVYMAALNHPYGSTTAIPDHQTVNVRQLTARVAALKEERQTPAGDAPVSCDYATVIASLEHRMKAVEEQHSTTGGRVVFPDYTVTGQIEGRLNALEQQLRTLTGNNGIHSVSAKEFANRILSLGIVHDSDLCGILHSQSSRLDIIEEKLGDRASQTSKEGSSPPTVEAQHIALIDADLKDTIIQLKDLKTRMKKASDFDAFKTHLAPAVGLSSQADSLISSSLEMHAQRVALVDSTLKDAAARLKDVTTRLKNVEDKFIASTCKEDLVQTKVYKIDVLENRMNTWEPQTKVLGSKVQSLEARVDNLSKAGAKVDGAKLAKVDTLEKNLSKASSKIAEVERKVGKADALEKKTEALEKKVGNVDAFHTKVTTLTTRVNNMDNLKADEKKFDKLRIRVDNLTNRLDALVRKVDNSNVKLAALDKGTDNTAFKVLEAEVKDLETAIQQLNVTQALGKGLSDGKFRDLEERIDQQLDILDGRGDHVEGLSAHVEVVPKDGVARRAARSETTAGTTDEDGNDTPSPTSEEWENADDIEVIRDRES